MHFSEESKTLTTHKLRIQACFLVPLFWTPDPSKTMGNFLQISIARQKCLCVSRNVVLWSKQVCIIILVLMIYLKLCNRPFVRLSRRVPAMFLHVPSTFLKPVTVFELSINIFLTMTNGALSYKWISK